MARLRRRLAAVLCALGLLATGSVRADILLAGVTESSGPAAPAGTAFRNGYELAIDEVNAGGGVLGQRLQLRQFDVDTSEPAVRAAMKSAAALQPFAVLGPVFSGLTLVAMETTAATSTPHFTGGEAASLTRKFHPSLLRTSLTQQESIPRLTAFAVHGMGVRKLGVLWLDNEFGRSAHTVLQEAASRRGARLSFDEGVSPSTRDWGPVVQRLMASQVDAVMLLLTENEAVAALTELRARHFAKPVLGDGPMASNRVVGDPSGVAEGLIGHSAISVDLPAARMQQFVADYQRRFGSRPDHNSLKGYFAVQALRMGLEAVGKPDKAALLAYLKDARLDGKRQPALMTAWVRYDMFGDLNRESYILQAHGGRMRLVATMSALDSSFATLPDGRSLALDSDEFRSATRALLDDSDAARAGTRAHAHR